MSIRPISYNEDTKIYRMLHEEESHEFDILLTDLQHTVKLDGSPNHDLIVVPCLVCSNTFSTHPVGGGADPLNIQQLFVNKITETGCACGNVEAGNENLADAHAHLSCARMDGTERWQI